MSRHTDEIKEERSFSAEEPGTSSIGTRFSVLVFSLRALRNVDWFGFAALREIALEDERGKILISNI